jgi:hypothetical protein
MVAEARPASGPQEFQSPGPNPKPALFPVPLQCWVSQPSADWQNGPLPPRVYRSRGIATFLEPDAKPTIIGIARCDMDAVPSINGTW